jgi:hypothetical protein
MSEKLQQDHYRVTPKNHEHPAGTPDDAGGVKEKDAQYLAGRGAQFNTKNRFLKNESTREHIEGIDDWEASNTPTQYLEQESKRSSIKWRAPMWG